MISIVTGKINGGKTTKLKSLYDESKIGDGFISLKTMQDNHPIAYHMYRLTTEEKHLFICRDKTCKPEMLIHETIGPYHISASTYAWVNEIIQELIEQKIEPLYFDEVGLLEVNKKGFYPLIKTMIDSELDVVFVVRKDLLKRFEKTFGISNYTLRKVE